MNMSISPANSKFPLDGPVKPDKDSSEPDADGFSLLLFGLTQPTLGSSVDTPPAEAFPTGEGTGAEPTTLSPEPVRPESPFLQTKPAQVPEILPVRPELDIAIPKQKEFQNEAESQLPKDGSLSADVNNTARISHQNPADLLVTQRTSEELYLALDPFDQRSRDQFDLAGFSLRDLLSATPGGEEGAVPAFVELNTAAEDVKTPSDANDSIRNFTLEHNFKPKELSELAEVVRSAGTPETLSPGGFAETGNITESRSVGQLAESRSPEVYRQVQPEIVQFAARMMPSNEPRSLKLRLHPAELGSVEVTIVKSDSGSVSAQLMTETAGAMESLSENLVQLRESLENAGLQVEQIEIGCRSFSSAEQGGERGREPGTVSTASTTAGPNETGVVSQMTADPEARLISLRA